MYSLLTVGATWSQTYATNYLKEEAHKLLAGGVTPVNQTRAIELSLAIASDYGGAVAKGPGLRYWTTTALVVLIFLWMYFCPKVEIGIWRGKARLKRWRIWGGTVFISIPTLLLSTLGMPWILKSLGLLP